MGHHLLRNEKTRKPTWDGSGSSIRLAPIPTSRILDRQAWGAPSTPFSGVEGAIAKGPRTE